MDLDMLNMLRRALAEMFEVEFTHQNEILLTILQELEKVNKNLEAIREEKQDIYKLKMAVLCDVAGLEVMKQTSITKFFYS